MDSFQKRDRERRKLQKRRDKQDRRKERAESKHQHGPDSAPAKVPSEEIPSLASHGPATGLLPEGAQP